MKYLSAILAALSFSISLLAQTSGGRLIVTVTDQSGAVINAATLSIINERTSQERKVTTNSDGVYAALQLEPSTYTIRASQQGFGDSEAKGLTIQVGQELRSTLVLSVSSTSAVVNVEGGSLSTVDTSSAKVGVNVSEREVAELPLNGRQVSQLYLLTPGAVNSGGGSFDNIRFSGRSNQQNIIRFDGVEGSSIVDASPGNLNGETTSNFRLQQSLENIQEFRVDSSNYPAEYGTGTGGQISVITKSGSNDLHGSLFEYLRNDFFDARNFFAGKSVDKLRLNQFGGSLGGSIIRNKMFFFGSYEALRQRTASPFVETTLSAAARAAPHLRFVVAGPQYPKKIRWPDNVERIIHLSPSEHRRFYNSQRFTLNVTRSAMVQAGFSPSVRLFEAAACGTPIISDAWPGLESIFSPKEEILIARNANDVLQILRELPDVTARAIGTRARERVLAEHTSAHRAAQLEQFIKAAARAGSADLRKVEIAEEVRT